jgi:ankyrin repeat protein
MSGQEKNNKDLLLAAQNNDLEGVRAALGAGADSNAQASLMHRCYTALHFAAGDGSVDMIRELIKAGASVDSGDQNGRTPLELALEGRHNPNAEEISYELAAASANAQCKSEYAIAFAAERGFVRVIDVLVAAGFEMVKGGSRGSSPIESAAVAGSVAGVAKMIELGVSIESRDRWGYAPLHTAANLRHFNLAKWLLDAGANPNATEHAGNTPLHFTALVDAAT